MKDEKDDEKELPCTSSDKLQAQQREGTATTPRADNPVPDGAAKLLAPFGLKPKVERFSTSPYTYLSIRADLYEPNDDPVGYVVGALAASVSRQICHHLNVGYDFGGLDSTHRSCCENLIAHLMSGE